MSWLDSRMQAGGEAKGDPNQGSEVPWMRSQRVAAILVEDRVARGPSGFSRPGSMPFGILSDTESGSGKSCWGSASSAGRFRLNAHRCGALEGKPFTPDTNHEKFSASPAVSWTK